MNISRKWVFIVGLIFITFQATFGQQWSFNVHGGPGFSKMFWVNKAESTPGFFIQYPETQFRTGFVGGLGAEYKLNDIWYLPIQADFIGRRFSVSTGGVVFVQDDNGQFIAVMTDYLEYRNRQVCISGGIGYKAFSYFSLELMPYIFSNIGKQQIKVGNVIDWREVPDFQYSYDFGLSMFIKAGIKDFFVKAGYQHGLRSITEYSVYDAAGQSLGKFPIRHSMFQLLAGYRF